MLTFEQIVIMATLFVLAVNTVFLGYVLWVVKQVRKENRFYVGR